MMADFDVAASAYDQVFVDSHIGRRQRQRVYHYLKDTVFSKLQVLELNCGTGEDALWMASNGAKVHATDLSDAMLNIASTKAGGNPNISFDKMDIRSMTVDILPGKYNLIYSNFGGLNCLNHQSLEDFFKEAHRLLEPSGRIVMVIMPKFCLIESIYMMLKGRWKHIFRRWRSDHTLVNVDGVNVTTWYYSPNDIRNLAKPFFKMIKTKPVGILIPPSYLESFFSSRLRLLSILSSFEKALGRFSVFSGWSDHFYIEIEKI